MQRWKEGRKEVLPFIWHLRIWSLTFPALFLGIVEGEWGGVRAQNVGVGTTFPQARLHVEVPAGFSSPLFLVKEQGSAVPYLIIDSSGLVGIRWMPVPSLWANLPENQQPAVWFRGRMVQNRGGVPSELYFLPQQEADICLIDLRNVVVDIGDTVRYWLRRCRNVRVLLDSSRTYTWNTRVVLQPYQWLDVRTYTLTWQWGCTVSNSSNSYDTTNCGAKIIITKIDTFEWPPGSGNLYREPARVLLLDGAYLFFFKVRIEERVKSTLPLTPREWKGLFSIGSGTANARISFHSVLIRSSESIVNFYGWSWGHVYIGHAHIFNADPGLRNIYVTIADAGWAFTGHGGVVHRSMPHIRFWTPGILWDTSGRIIYRD